MVQKHVVEKGEWLQKIAENYGFVSWRALYDYHGNDEFRAKRPDPNHIFPGDELFIPEKSASVALETNAVYRVVLTPAVVGRLRFRPITPQGESLAGRDYKLTAGGVEHAGKVPSTGFVDHPLPPGATQATLKITLDDSHVAAWVFELGAIAPIETLPGLQARLKLLRYYFGDISEDDGNPDLATKVAIQAFQLDHELPANGVACPTTTQKLKEVFGT